MAINFQPYRSKDFQTKNFKNNEKIQVIRSRSIRYAEH